MTVPAELRYSKAPELVRLEADGTVSVGITDHAQERLGDMVFVELPDIGRKLKTGTECAVVESVKAAADVYAPVGGEVVAANATLRDAPQSINENAYAAWLFRLKPDNPAELGILLDARAYTEQAASEE